MRAPLVNNVLLMVCSIFNELDFVAASCFVWEAEGEDVGVKCEAGGSGGLLGRLSEGLPGAVPCISCLQADAVFFEQHVLVCVRLFSSQFMPK